MFFVSFTATLNRVDYLSQSIIEKWKKRRKKRNKIEANTIKNEDENRNRFKNQSQKDKKNLNFKKRPFVMYSTLLKKRLLIISSKK